MSSGKENNSGVSSDGGADMEASQATSDSSQQAQSGTPRDENKSKSTESSGPSRTNTSVDAGNSERNTTTASGLPSEVAPSLDLMDMDGGSSPPSSTQAMDVDGTSSTIVPPRLSETPKSDEPSDIVTDAVPDYQPETVALPPLQPQTVAFQPERVELPPLDQSEQNVHSSPPSAQSSGTTSSRASTGLPPLDQKTGSEAGACASSISDESPGQSVYYIKWIHYKQNKVPVITQNENGPCPLLAILNVLLLKGKVKLAPMLQMITSEQLMTYLGECILDSMPENLTESQQANYEQNMQDAMSVMHKLQTGLDVNVKFTGISDFEYTPECIIFDLLRIPLFHGWLVDPQDPVCASAVGTCSYNQLVEKIIAQKSSDKEDVVTEALVVEQFLDRTASQLTYYGLCELTTSVKEGELCVFFRNNHFSTLYRINNELFLLLTDQGFLTESNVVWETLSNVEGDCHFVDANFRTYTRPEPSGNITPSAVEVGSDMQIDQDYQVALSLQQEAELRDEEEAAWGQYTPETTDLQRADHELARRLQEEEDRRAAAAVNASQQRAAQQQQQQQGQGHTQGQGHPQGSQCHTDSASHSSGSRHGHERHREEKKEKDCTIL